MTALNLTWRWRFSMLLYAISVFLVTWALCLAATVIHQLRPSPTNPSPAPTTTTTAMAGGE